MRRIASVSLDLTLWCLAGPLACSIATSVAKPTALERQLLGAYEELDRDLILASSVRGAGPHGEDSIDALRELALSARALQRFNEDDLFELKGAGCVAESLMATLVIQSCQDADAKDPALAARLLRVVDEENRARATILKFAAMSLAREAGRQNPSPEEEKQMRDTYRRLLMEAAQKGHRFENQPGVFSPVVK